MPTYVPLPPRTSGGVPVTKSSRATGLVYTDRRVGARSGPRLLPKDSPLLRKRVGRARPPGVLDGSRPVLAPATCARNRIGSWAHHLCPRTPRSGGRRRHFARNARTRLPKPHSSGTAVFRRGRHANGGLSEHVRPHRGAERPVLASDLGGGSEQGAPDGCRAAFRTRPVRS